MTAAERMRRVREKKAVAPAQHVTIAQPLRNVTKAQRATFVPPTVEEAQYC